jgi:hypothetical protein
VNWLYLSAILMVLTALVHSLLGEKRIIGPFLDSGSAIARNPHSRKVLRSAWHLTSLFMVVTAAVVAWPETPGGLVKLVGGAWLLVGVFSLVTSRGKHPGWPFLSGAGIAAILGVTI